MMMKKKNTMMMKKNMMMKEKKNWVRAPLEVSDKYKTREDLYNLSEFPFNIVSKNVKLLLS